MNNTFFKSKSMSGLCKTAPIVISVLLLLGATTHAEANNLQLRECNVGAARMTSSADLAFEPIPALALHLDAEHGDGLRVDCTITFAENGWFLHGTYQQTIGDLTVDLRLDDEVATGRYFLDQRIGEFNIGYRAEVTPTVSLSASLGYSRSSFEPDDFLLLLPSGAAQFDHRRGLRVNAGGLAVVGDVRWKASQLVEVMAQVRYRDKSAYKIAGGARLRSEVLGRIGIAIRLTEPIAFVMETTVGEQSSTTFAGLRLRF